MWRAIPATGSRPRSSATPSRFTLSFRDVEDLLAQRGITVSYESIRLWCETFGVAYARRLRRRSGPVGDT
jgi:putative transposase